MKRNFALLIALTLTACAHTDGKPELLATKSGMTVYTFDKDAPGKSNCAGQCLAIWPAVKPSDVSGANVGTITRDDGTKQASFKGKPIYLFAADSKPGDAKGDNMENVWHVVPLTDGVSGRRGTPERSGYGRDGGYSYGY